jgi:hypothetical protein
MSTCTASAAIRVKRVKACDVGGGIVFGEHAERKMAKPRPQGIDRGSIGLPMQMMEGNYEGDAGRLRI